MKYILSSLLLLFVAAAAHAEPVDLETDQGFFGSTKGVDDEDDLDRAYKQREANKPAKQLETNDVTVKGEIGSGDPGIMSRTEAEANDQMVLAENKRRQQAIFRTLAANSSMVRTCIDQNKKSFQGTQIRLAWLIDPAGKVLQTAVKDTDFTNNEVQACVQAAAKQLDFSSAATHQFKKSLVEYTYKVNLKQTRRPASVPGKALQKAPAKAALTRSANRP
jgi:hypothetical protein